GRITTTGAVKRYAGTGISNPQGIAAGPDSAMWFTNRDDDSIGRITTTGTVTDYRCADSGRPVGIAAGPDGALWFTTFWVNTIGRITTTVTPKIGGFTPAQGRPGTTVTITGKNLSGTTKVAFNGTPAFVVSATATQIVTRVPVG